MGCRTLALLAALGCLGAAPADQTQVFRNARLALREGRPKEALRAWLLRNALVDAGRPVSRAEDGDFRSVVWAAVGEQGFCPDGLPKDTLEEGGAGLWPLAMFNWAVRSMGRSPPAPPQERFLAFQSGRQSRLISLQDTLTLDELRTANFYRTDCEGAWKLARKAKLAYDMSSREAVGDLLLFLLTRARETLDASRVEHMGLLDARAFDLELTLARSSVRRAKRDARSAAALAKRLGLSEAETAEVEAASLLDQMALARADLLRGSLAWSAGDWLALSPPRRLFLFAQARPLAETPDAVERLMLSVIDALAARGDGAEAQAWIGFHEASFGSARRASIWSGERGLRLLELEPASGFRERAPIALSRGVAFLEEGRREDALRSFALAMAASEDSSEAGRMLGLSRRWMSFTLSRFETSDAVLATLNALVPRQERQAVLEELAWRAALAVDRGSFERAAATARRGGLFGLDAPRLRLLAQGKTGVLAEELRAALNDEPYYTLRFMKRLVEKIEVEDGDVRQAYAPFLRQLVRLVEPLAAETSGSIPRAAEELASRCQALLEGLRALDLTERARARSLSLAKETFAGNLRLAPADPLPWPFAAVEPELPSPFTPLVLTPIERRDADGVLRYRWRLSE